MHTLSEQDRAERARIIRREMANTMSFLASIGQAISPEQLPSLNERAGQIMTEAYSGEPSHLLPALVPAALLRAVGESVPGAGGRLTEARVLELGAMGAATARHLVDVGGYPAPSPHQLDELMGSISYVAGELVAGGVAEEQARELIRTFAAEAVAKLMGPPPSRVNLN
ncbi:hypothetical protein NR798_28660 [Archangium gephyra]|uniref:hypothetical protein n=1 Tax=Archangium gephyra TaxID=48 RepID=UPI0035D4857D